MDLTVESPQKICLGSTPSLCVTIIDSPSDVVSSWLLQNPDYSVASGTPDDLSFCIPQADIYVPDACGMYQYTIRVTRGTHTGEVTVIVYVYPVLTAHVLDYPGGNDIATLCWGEDATLRMDGLPPGCMVKWEYGDGGTWNPMPGSGGGMGNPYNTNPITWIPEQDCALFFRGVVNPACVPGLLTGWPDCSLSGSVISIDIRAHPSAGSIIASPQKLCTPPYVGNHQNDLFSLELEEPIIGDVITWSYAGPAGAAFGDIHSPQTVFTVCHAGTYDIRVQVSNGTCPAFVQTTQIIIEHPIIATLSSNVISPAPGMPPELCWGEDAKLMVNHNGLEGTQVRWEYQINCQGSWISTGVGGTTQNTNRLFDHSYTLPSGGPCPPDRICWRAVITSPTGICVTYTPTLTIMVIVPPNAPLISPAATQMICAGDSVTLTAGTPDPNCGTGPFTYEWFHNGLSVGTGQQFSATLPGYYQVVRHNKNGCASAGSAPVLVRVCTVLVEIIKGPCFCRTQGTDILFIAGAQCSIEPPGPLTGECTGPFRYLWSVDPPDTLPQPNHQSVTIPCPAHTTTYWVEAYNQMGCRRRHYFEIKRCV